MRYLRLTGSRMPLTLSVLAAMAVVVVPMAYPANIAGDWEERVVRQLPFAPGGSLEVRSRNGSVEISSWDKEEIKIVMEKRVSVGHGGTWFARFQIASISIRPFVVRKLNVGPPVPTVPSIDLRLMLIGFVSSKSSLSWLERERA